MCASKVFITTLLFPILLLSTACSTGEELRSNVANVQLGATKASVLLQLGTPAAVNTTNILGVEFQGLVFRRGSTACELGIFADHVVSRTCRTLPL